VFTAIHLPSLGLAATTGVDGHEPSPRHGRDAGGDGRSERLDAAMQRLLARRGIVHAVAGVSTFDGSFRWRGAGGETRPHGPTMGAQTPFFAASITKLFIATIVLQLAEEERLDLDGSITRVLPPSVTDGLHVLDGVDHTARITPRHLLGHTSGLPDFLEDRPSGGRSWYRELRHGADRSWTFEDVVTRSRDELRPRFAPQDLTAGRQRARYSDTGYQLLIRTVEEVTGASFGDELERRLLRPLGMRQTYLPGRTEPLDPAPAPAVLYDGRRAIDVPRALVSCHDLVSTVGDLERFLTAWAGGALLADPATWATTRATWNRIGYPLRYGLGVMRFPVARLLGPGRRPATLIGHSGATGTWAFHCPELELVLIGTVDQIGGRTIPFRFMGTLLRAYHG
jgi:D-alanyl-D-alanine carboxypeptidase